jgi:predicted NBD/HSP70 family sugar kinase
MLSRGMKPSTVRRANQRALLLIISREPGISNAELSRKSGLAPQTVSAVLADLEAASLLTRGPARRGKRGQPATPVFLNPQGAFAVGAEIGWQHIEIVLMNLGREQLGRYRRDYAFPDARAVFEELGAETQKMIKGLSAKERKRLVGVGLAMPGGIGDPASLIRLPADQAALWKGIHVETRVEEVTGLHANLFNDGNAACFADLVAHTTVPPQNFMYLLIDTFVAGGILAEGRLWEGPTGRSANLGSVRVCARQGETKFLHEIASLHALSAQCEQAGVSFAEVTGEAPSLAAQQVLDAWIDEAAPAIAQVVLNTAAVIECEVAVLEAALPPPLRLRLVEAVSEQLGQIPTLGVRRPTLKEGSVGGSGAARGAAQLWIYRRFFTREIEYMDD